MVTETHQFRVFRLGVNALTLRRGRRAVILNGVKKGRFNKVSDWLTDILTLEQYVELKKGTFGENSSRIKLEQLTIDFP